MILIDFALPSILSMKDMKNVSTLAHPMMWHELQFLFFAAWWQYFNLLLLEEDHTIAVFGFPF